MFIFVSSREALALELHFLIEQPTFEGELKNKASMLGIRQQFVPVLEPGTEHSAVFLRSGGRNEDDPLCQKASWSGQRPSGFYSRSDRVGETDQKQTS